MMGKYGHCQKFTFYRIYDLDSDLNPTELQYIMTLNHEMLSLGMRYRDEVQGRGTAYRY